MVETFSVGQREESNGKTERTSKGLFGMFKITKIQEPHTYKNNTTHKTQQNKFTFILMYTVEQRTPTVEVGGFDNNIRGLNVHSIIPKQHLNKVPNHICVNRRGVKYRGI